MKEIETLYKNYQSTKTRPSASELVRLLSIIIGNFVKVFVFIDALDECLDEYQSELITEIQSLNPKTSLLITSRPSVHPELDTQNMYRLDIRASNADIKSYLEESISKSPRLKIHVNKQPLLKDRITIAIKEKAQNM